MKKEQFELLCTDGTRASVDEYKTCNWGTVPSRAIVTSSEVSFEDRKRYQKFLSKAAQIFNKNRTMDYNNRGGFNNPNEYSTDWDRNGYNRSFGSGGGNRIDDTYTNNNFPKDFTESVQVRPIEMFDLYESPKYGKQHNLMFSVRHYENRLFALLIFILTYHTCVLLFQDSTIDFVPLPEKNQAFGEYLGSSTSLITDNIRRCPVHTMTLCVTSQAELKKCFKMKVRFKLHIL